MAHPFELTYEAEVPATPQQAWEAVTVGPQIDSWFMGRNEVEPRVGGTARLVHPGFTAESTITAWEPPTRFAFSSAEAADGSRMAFDYRIDQPNPGRTRVRWIHSGAIAGDDWEAEYEAMGEGDPMYFQKLAEYLTYFAGRLGVPIDAFGPEIDDRERALQLFREGLGLPDPVALGDVVRLTPEGFDPIDGVVDYDSPSFLGVRSDDALYRFIWAFTGSAWVGHHDFSGSVDPAEASAAWQSWLEKTFA
jgi:uncharacterized protein YndB with AHSA1/START domain